MSQKSGSINGCILMYQDFEASSSCKRRSKLMAGIKKKTPKIMLKDEITTKNAWLYGNWQTRLSLVIMGFGNFVNKQIIQGLIYLGIEILYIFYMVTVGVGTLKDFITLGTVAQQEVFNEATQMYEYVVGDNSMLCLLYGVVTIFISIFFVVAMCTSMRSAYASQVRVQHGRKPLNFKETLKSLKQQKLQSSMLSLPVLGILCFNIVPTTFMILIAFTNYDKDHQTPGNLFDWVGLENFQKMFMRGSRLAETFWPVLGWTLVWAVFATITSFILGLLLALVINRKGTRFKPFWRFIFVLSIAVPQFVSLLTMRTIFHASGPVNIILKNLGILTGQDFIPFWQDGTLAKVMIILVNIWIGVPYTMLQTTGILQNIPADLYEAADVDGAGPVVKFFKITMPYMLFVMTPYLITQFTGNINNFNVIYLLTGGGPERLDYYYAGETDLLITWLFKVTITNKDYNIGAVIGIAIFVIMSVLSLLTYRHTGSYKDEEAFQ